MSELAERARRDLERVSPGAWAEVYAEPLLQEIERIETGGAGALDRRVRSLTDLALLLGHSRRLVAGIGAALQQFERATGWSPKDGRQLKATPRRWAAAKALVVSVKSDLLGFLTAVRPITQRMAGRPSPATPEAAGGDDGRENAARLEAAVESITENAPDTPEARDALASFTGAVRTLRDRALKIDRHPVGQDPAYLRAGSVETLVAERGRCDKVGPGGRCWFYRDHPGRCDHRPVGGRDS